jgi:hypothetical protein
MTSKKKLSLKALNKPEPKERIIARLLVERNGKPADVSMSAALEFRRDAYGLSAAEFAFVLGIERSHYNEVINGRRSLPKLAMRRAFAIGVPAALLLQPETIDV